jgi:hypothetical protein
MINRYKLISILIVDNYLTESDRGFVASLSDFVLLTIYGASQFKCIRKGFYILIKYNASISVVAC